MRKVESPCVASMIVQVEGAEHLPDAQHVVLSDLFEGPGVLVVLLHLGLLLVHGCQALSAHHLKIGMVIKGKCMGQIVLRDV